MAQKQKGFVQLLVLFAVIMYLVLGFVTPIVNRRLSPTEGFAKFVCRPVPKSVTEIKMDRLIRWDGWHRYVFNFKIDEADLSPILNSWPFQEIKYFKYSPEYGGIKIGGLQNTPWEMEGMTLYNIRSGEAEPEWFNIEQLDSPKVYVYIVRDVYRLRLLVYSKKLGEAYFIDYRSPD